MKLKYLLVFALALLAICAGVALTLSNRRTLNRRLYNDVIASGLRDVRYRVALQTYADLRKGIDVRPVCVEAPIREDCINILVVDATSGDERSRSLNPLLHDLRLNALALPPNLILVDGKLLDFLIVTMYNSFIATVNRSAKDGLEAQAIKTAQAQDKSVEMHRLLEIESQAVRTALAQASFLEFENMANSFAVKRESPPIRELADRVLDYYQTDKNVARGYTTPLDLAVRHYLSAVFAILLEHEIAHLDAGHGLHWALSVKSVVDRSAAPVEYREELRADRVALDRALRLTKPLEPLDAAPETAPNRLLNRIPFLAYAEFLEDLAMYDGLEGFRGLSAKDLALSFVHTDCRSDSELEKDRGLERYPFNAVERVAVARRKPLPVLTEKEFSLLRSRLAGADLAQTHRHNLIRADEIVSSMAGPEFVEFQNPRQADYIRALLENRPSLAFPDSSGFHPILGTNIDRLLEGAKPTINFEPAVTCPLERCYVGSASDGDGFIEVIGTLSEVAVIRFVYDMHLSGGNMLRNQQWPTHDPKQEESYIRNMAQMLRLFAFLRSDKVVTGTPISLDDKVGMEAMLIAGYLRDPLFQCNIGSQEYRSGGLLYRSESLSKPGWMEITVRAADSNAGSSPWVRENHISFESYSKSVTAKIAYWSKVMHMPELEHPRTLIPDEVLRRDAKRVPH